MHASYIVVRRSRWWRGTCQVAALTIVLAFRPAVAEDVGVIGDGVDSIRKRQLLVPLAPLHEAFEAPGVAWRQEVVAFLTNTESVRKELYMGMFQKLMQGWDWNNMK